MQPLVDLVGNITHAYTSTVKIVVLGAILLGVIITAMFLLAAPALVEEVGARTESISDKAIEAAREEARAHALAEDGWGFSDSAASSDTDAADSFDGGGDASGDDWGAGAE
jgi:hypothetical protein